MDDARIQNKYICVVKLIYWTWISKTLQRTRGSSTFYTVRAAGTDAGVAAVRYWARPAPVTGSGLRVQEAAVPGRFMSEAPPWGTAAGPFQPTDKRAQRYKKTDFTKLGLTKPGYKKNLMIRVWPPVLGPVFSVLMSQYCSLYLHNCVAALCPYVSITV